MTDTAQKTKIMLIDDDKFLLDTYSIKFTQEGYDVFACLSVDAALEALRKGFEPAVILFDILMPEKGGFDFLQSLQDEGLAKSSIKIALTNNNDDTEKQHAEEMGVSAYLIKASLIPSEVVSTVSSFLKKTE